MKQEDKKKESLNSDSSFSQKEKSNAGYLHLEFCSEQRKLTREMINNYNNFGKNSATSYLK